VGVGGIVSAVGVVRGERGAQRGEQAFLGPFSALPDRLRGHPVGGGDRPQGVPFQPGGGDDLGFNTGEDAR
jgi:hypothetical protein